MITQPLLAEFHELQWEKINEHWVGQIENHLLWFDDKDGPN